MYQMFYNFTLLGSGSPSFVQNYGPILKAPDFEEDPEY